MCLSGVTEHVPQYQPPWAFLPKRKEGADEAREMDRDNEVAHALVFCEMSSSTVVLASAHTPANGIGSVLGKQECSLPVDGREHSKMTSDLPSEDRLGYSWAVLQCASVPHLFFSSCCRASMNLLRRLVGIAAKAAGDRATCSRVLTQCHCLRSCRKCLPPAQERRHQLGNRLPSPESIIMVTSESGVRLKATDGSRSSKGSRRPLNVLLPPSARQLRHHSYARTSMQQ